jgi:hypothetical protein
VFWTVDLELHLGASPIATWRGKKHNHRNRDMRNHDLILAVLVFIQLFISLTKLISGHTVTRLLMNYGLEDLLQSNILKSSGVNVISRTMMKILANMMTGLIKVFSWVMLQIVKGIDATIRDRIN